MALIGKGSAIYYESGSTYIQITGVRSITPPAISVNKIDTTALDGTSTTMTAIGGMIDPGTVTFEMEFDSTQFSTLYAMTGDVFGWKIETPAADITYTFDGYISKPDDISIAPGDMIVVKYEVQVCGEVVVA